MTPEQARDLEAEVAAVSKQAQALVAGMNATALMTGPASGGWSVAENLQHLILTSSAMLRLSETAIFDLERARKTTTRPSGLGFVGWLLVKSLEPPSRIKTKTAKSFEPGPVSDPLTLLARFLESNAKLEGLITRATGLATASVKIVSPIDARAKYNVYAAFRIMLSHARRHLFQAEQAKAIG